MEFPHEQYDPDSYIDIILQEIEGHAEDVSANLGIFDDKNRVMPEDEEWGVPPRD